MKAYLALLVFLFANSSCNNALDLNEVDQIDYSFHDASVAPEHHRSYTISINFTQLIVTIKSYSNILHREARPFSRKKFEEARKKFVGLKSADDIEESEIPTGGSSESFRLLNDGKEIFYGEDYGADNRNFTGVNDISLSYLVPDLSVLIEATRNKNQ